MKHESRFWGILSSNGFCPLLEFIFLWMSSFIGVCLPILLKITFDIYYVFANYFISLTFCFDRLKTNFRTCNATARPFNSMQNWRRCSYFQTPSSCVSGAEKKCKSIISTIFQFYLNLIYQSQTARTKWRFALFIYLISCQINAWKLNRFSFVLFFTYSKISSKHIVQLWWKIPVNNKLSSNTSKTN